MSALQSKLFTVQTNTDDTYSKKVKPPQYLPSKKKPVIDELMNYKKYSQLLVNIERSNVSEEEKKFLRFAATRHIVFNYGKIADYYAHSNKEMQQLMEESALVIIDMDDAIQNGYVKLSKTIKKIMDETGRKANEG